MNSLIRYVNSKTGLFWKRVSNNLQKQYEKTGLTNFKRNAINQHFAGRYPQTILEISALWQMYQHVLQSKNDKLISLRESLVGNPYQVNLNGVDYSWDWLQACEEYLNIVSVFKIKPTDKLTIVEIGAGYGRLAEVFLKMMPNILYVNVDIEPARSIFNEYMWRIGYAHRVTSSVLPASADLVINIDSFQEMSQAQVKEYLQKIENLTPKYIYFKNSISQIHNLIDNRDFKLREYPKTFFCKPVIERISRIYPDMLEQFWVNIPRIKKE